MGSNPQPPANGSPPKPWERAGATSVDAPFKPQSAGSTGEVVEASGTARPGEIVSCSNGNTTINGNPVRRHLPSMPWEQGYGNGSYGGFGSSLNYNSGYSSCGGLGGLYGGGMYGNIMYRGGYGGLYGNGMYSGGMYDGCFGGPMGGYGMGMGGPHGVLDPNNPDGAPPSPPGFWVSLLRVMQEVVNFFGRIAILIDQNTQALHMFMTALLLIFDRSGLLYGELARFVLRLLGTRSRRTRPVGPNGLPLPLPNGSGAPQNPMEGPKGALSGSWDDVWEKDAKN